MFGLKLRDRNSIVAGRRGVASVGPPQSYIGRLIRLVQEIFVVAGESDDPVGTVSLHIYDGLDHAAAFRATVDVVAEEDEVGWLSFRKPAAVIEQPCELFEATVNVADRKGEHGSGPVGSSVGFFPAVVRKRPQDDFTVERVGLKHDIHASPVMMKEGCSEVDPDGFLALALDDGIGP